MAHTWSASEIISKSHIGTIDGTCKMLTGGTFGDYRNQVERALDKVLAVVPKAVAQVGAENAGYQAQAIFMKLVKQIGKSDYFTADGRMSEVTVRNLDDVAQEIMVAAKAAA